VNGTVDSGDDSAWIRQASTEFCCCQCGALKRDGNLVNSLCVPVQDAQTTQSLLKLADLARDATFYGNNLRVDGLHRV
jgi:hypothetical protein